MRIAMLHIAPVTGDIEHNRKLIERGVVAAKEAGAQWAITPELSVSGYLFLKSIGTGWINPQPGLMDDWLPRIREAAGHYRVPLAPGVGPGVGENVQLGLRHRPDGEITGRHRKVKALGGAEAWSSPGWRLAPCL